VSLTVREAEKDDLKQLLELYAHLHGEGVLPVDYALEKTWYAIVDDSNHHILVGVADGKIVSSCVVVIIMNLTRGGRPYALVENVVTHVEHRKRGYASSLLDRAKQIAKNENCYKIMLMTGSKRESTLNFYRRAGYNSNDKTAFIQWI